MAKYNITLKRSAAKELRGIPQEDRSFLIEKIQQLSQNPYPPQSQKLTSKEQYRLRWGKYRILYEIKQNILTILVVKIGQKKDVYK